MDFLDALKHYQIVSEQEAADLSKAFQKLPLTEQHGVLRDAGTLVRKNQLNLKDLEVDPLDRYAVMFYRSMKNYLRKVRILTRKSSHPDKEGLDSHTRLAIAKAKRTGLRGRKPKLHGVLTPLFPTLKRLREVEKMTYPQLVKFLKYQHRITVSRQYLQSVYEHEEKEAELSDF